ncbi:hypothetical protein BV25DRAFT_1956450 [Artomyces pyxidatus]|uniref:Uncharacterized protein n=1 Tax=Artomyces pyxidatus TaxID=48021 RepID=A0ACB8SUL1_9AGAM|nr:hypothetical protein BV25DRAFT_1956450 [Artomyces pyxidatus]
MVVSPPNAWGDASESSPFHLVVDVALNFHTPAIFEPLPKRWQGPRVPAEEAKRSLIQLAFPAPPLPPQLSSSFHGKIDIPFFYSILQPALALDSKTIQDAVQPAALIPTLLPFQRRSVAWMLQREGKTINPAEDVVLAPKDDVALPLFWERVIVERPSGEQLVWYYHHLTTTLTPDPPLEEQPAPGGILAEEPGLGKTLECIALILLNPGIGRNPSNTHWDAEASVEVKEIKTTLIVTPAALCQQWIDELALHAPSLKVFKYEGWSKLPVPITKKLGQKKRSTAKSKKGKQRAMEVHDDVPEGQQAINSETEVPADWCSYVSTYDVCITTYNTLQQDLNIARAPPVRPRREVAEYSRTERPRSPLVLCEWYRVIMDEVQMVGGGKTSYMVSLIPRLSSFAVSGTPARSQVADLSHILRFLRVPSTIYSPRNWKRLMEPQLAGDFAALVQHYTIRTTKAAVSDELTIPQQSRYLVPIELGPVERHVYDHYLEKALLELGLDARGVAASENWTIDTGLLRTWLRKLRQLCTHPQVGQLLKQGEKTRKPGGLKTMAEVLQGMRDQNWRNLMEDRRSKVNELAATAQMMQHDQTIESRHKKALDILLQAEKEADQLINDLNEALNEHEATGATLKKEAAALREARGQGRRPTPFDDPSGKGKARAAERDMSPLSDNDSDDDWEDDELPKTPAGEEHINKKRALQQRLREVYLTTHRVKFLQGDVYHVLGEGKAAEEDAAYAAAEALRRRLLKFTEQSAQRAMAQLAKDAGRNGFTEHTMLVNIPFCPPGGIRSKELMEEADGILDNILNAQSRLLWKWRQHIFGLLTQSLTANEAEADGQEYSRTLDTQGEAETYLQAYAALLADRREVLSAERTALAAHDAKERKYRKTKAALKATAAFLDDDEDVDVIMNEDVELQPEHEVLKTELGNARKTLLEQYEGRAVKSVMVDLTAIAAKIVRDDDKEKIIAKDGAMKLRRLMTIQVNINDQIEADLAQFRRAFNERITYFRQLQEISDSVVEGDWDHDVSVALEGSKAIQNELEANINRGRARQRYACFFYLDHLAQQDMEDDEDEEGCILCKCEFTRGYITQCAHVFCEDCMKSWLARQNKACPVCRRVPINVDTLERFSVQDGKDKNKPAQSLPQKLTRGEPAPKSRRKIDYNIIRSGLAEEIDSMESHGSYGTKIQTLVRHLLYLQLADSGGKSIVFSAWADSLHIIEHALTTNGISCIRVDSSRGKQDASKRFRTDPNILVLLLHGERENAGLNVTCASRVFLLESVVHHSFEIQAIARIDRLGQSKPTEVYCYYAEDTVEKNILDLAARQGLSLYTNDHSHGTLNITPFAPEAEKSVVDSPSKKKQKGDFIFKLDDMMSILFPHLYEDLEFLLPPPEEMSAQDDAMDTSPQTPVRAHAMDLNVNAVAGPSRLA